MNVPHNTVIVLGAGASADVGYPTNKQLHDAIYIKLSTKNDVYRANELYKAALAAGFQSDHILSFGKLLHQSTAETVDEFLRFSPSFRGLGKFCIAHELIRIEDQPDLIERGKKCWYQIFRKAIGLDLHSPPNNISIITFNYDRSLKHFIYLGYEALHESLHHPHAIRNAVGKLGFLHVHGELSPLPWTERRDSREYGPVSDAKMLRTVSQSILIADEASDASYHPEAPSVIVKQASKIIFLGFGFHQENMRKLGLTSFSRPSTQQFIATVRDDIPRRKLKEITEQFDLKTYSDIPSLFADDPLSN